MDQYCPNRHCEARQISIGPLEKCPTCSGPLILNERYQIIHPLSDINSGKETEVFVAHDTKKNKKVVIKSLLTANKKLITMYSREVYVLQYIVHPNKPRSELRSEFTLEIENQLYRMLVMDWVEGITLKEWLKTNTLKSDGEVIAWLKQLFSVLDKIHELEYFHRDINPNNIIVGPDSKLTLIDYGACRDQTNTYLNKVSKGLEERYDYEVTSIFTIDYAPREQVHGRALPQSDFYSLALTLIHCITGIIPSRLPYDTASGKYKWRHLATGISDAICDYLDILCHPSPGYRPHNTEIILKHLETLPARIRRRKIIRSPIIQFMALIAVVSAISITYYFGSRAISEYEIILGINDNSEERYVEAQSHFKRSLAWKPSTEAYNNLINVCARIGDDQCLDNAYRNAIKFEPKNVDIRFRLGSYYEDIREYELAAKLYAEAIDVSPNNSSSSKNNLARLKILESDYEEALELISKAIYEESEKNNPKKYILSTLYKNKGWALLELGDREGAKIALVKALEYDSLEVSANCLLARIINKRKYWSVCFNQISYLPEIQRWRDEFLKKVIKD